MILNIRRRNWICMLQHFSLSLGGLDNTKTAKVLSRFLKFDTFGLFFNFYYYETHFFREIEVNIFFFKQNTPIFHTISIFTEKKFVKSIRYLVISLVKRYFHEFFVKICETEFPFHLQFTAL